MSIGKSEGLRCGNWQCRKAAPMGLKWNNEGLKLLGIYLGNSDDYVNKNWSELGHSVQTKLEWWARFAEIMSYHGRIHVINQLIASKLNHKFISTYEYVQLFMQNSNLDFNLDQNQFLPNF